MKKIGIMIIGALPPPYIGPTIATKNLISAPNIKKAFELILVDTSDPRPIRSMGKLDFVNVGIAVKNVLTFLSKIVLKRPTVIYIAISQNTWGYFRDLCFFIPAVLLKKQVVIHLRGSEFADFYCSMSFPLKFLTKILFRNVAFGIVLGNSVRHVFNGLIEESNIVVIHNGINYKEFDEVNVSRSHSSSKRILFLSGLRRRKGILLFIEALPLVINRCAEIEVIVAGEWIDYDDKNAAEKLIRKHAIEDKIKFVGNVTGKKKYELYKTSDIFVFPPVEPEGMPWVILEAMSAGIPVISTDQGTISEVIEDGVSGFIIEPNKDEIAKKICFLIENPEVSKRMGLRGRQIIEERFSDQIYYKKIEETFRKAALSKI